MTWLIAGLIAPFLWAITNIVDQVVIRKHYKNNTLLIMTISGFVSIFPLIGITLYNPTVFLIDPVTAFLFLFGAIISFAGYYTYFKAMEMDEASNAIPVFQLIPIFVFTSAYFILKETINFQQGLGASIVLIAAISLNINFETKKINWKTIYLMGFCAVILAGVTLLDRFLLQETDWLTAMAWKALGYFLFFLGVCIVHKDTRELTINRLKKPLSYGLPLMFLIECFAFTGEAMFILSLEIAPIAGFVSTLTGFQGVYVLFLGYIGYKFLPDFFQKPKQGFHLVFHLLCLSVMLIGLYLIY